MDSISIAFITAKLNRDFEFIRTAFAVYFGLIMPHVDRYGPLMSILSFSSPSVESLNYLER